MPPALYEIGSALVVAVTVLPQLADSVRRVRAAQTLRGGDTGRVRGLRRLLVPVLEDALERSLALAAGMDTRGYGRTAGATPRERRTTGGLMLLGLVRDLRRRVRRASTSTDAGLARPPDARARRGGLARRRSGCAGRRVGRTPLPPGPVALAGAGRGDAPGVAGRRRPAGGCPSHQLTIAYPSLSVAPDAQRWSRSAPVGRRPGRCPAARRAPPRPLRREVSRDRAARHRLRLRRPRRVLARRRPHPRRGRAGRSSPGATGVGKSTLLGVRDRAGAALHRRHAVRRRAARRRGRSSTQPPRERAHVVGYVGQDPAAGFVTDTVEEELAYGMEQLGLPADTMRRRVEETLDLLGIADLRARDLRTLSGGEQQRVAIGSVLTMHPRVLVLDEPTSALDPTAAEEVLATLTRLVHDLGLSVLMAEHRLERVVPFADRMVLLTGDGPACMADARRTCWPARPSYRRSSSSAGALGWSPLPMTVRDARRLARGLRRSGGPRRRRRPTSADEPRRWSARR